MEVIADDCAPVTPSEAKRRVAAMLDTRARQCGLDGRAANVFTVMAWNDRGSSGTSDHIRLSIERKPENSETVAYPMRTDLRWPDAQNIREAVDAHAHRYARAVRRQNAGARTEQSLADPNWMMTTHRAVVEVLMHYGIVVGEHHDWARLRDAIRTRMSMMNLAVDAGRIHPLALRVSGRGEGAKAIYMSATMLSCDPMTTIILPHVLPETTMMAAAGRPLEDIVVIPGMGRGHTVRRVGYGDATGTVIELEHDEVAIGHPPAGADTTWMDRGAPDAEISKRKAA